MDNAMTPTPSSSPSSDRNAATSRGPAPSGDRAHDAAWCRRAARAAADGNR